MNSSAWLRLNSAQRAQLDPPWTWVDGVLTALAVAAMAAFLWFPPRAAAGELWLETGIGYDEHVYDGNNPMSVFRLRYEMQTSSWYLPRVLEWDHNSSIPDGKPFNDQREDTADQFSLIWRWRLH